MFFLLIVVVSLLLICIARFFSPGLCSVPCRYLSQPCCSTSVHFSAFLQSKASVFSKEECRHISLVSLVPDQVRVQVSARGKGPALKSFQNPGKWLPCCHLPLHDLLFSWVSHTDGCKIICRRCKRSWQRQPRNIFGKLRQQKQTQTPSKVSTQERLRKNRNYVESQSNHYWEKLFSQANSCCITKYTKV